MSPSASPSRRFWLVPLIAVTCLAAGCTPGSGPGNGPPNVATVTTFSDSGDGTCDSTCSLRDAIALANTDATIDTVSLPTGTFVVGGPVPLAAVHGRSRAVPSVRAAGGPSGEAFAVTAALTIEGTGVGSTVVDFSGDDYSVGWLASADLTLRNLTARNLGSGTTPQERDLIRADHAAPGGSVTLDHTGIDHIQPAMAAIRGLAGASVVDVVGGSAAISVTVSFSAISDIGVGGLGNLFRTGADGPLTISDSSLARVPALVVGYLGSNNTTGTRSLTLSRDVFSDTAWAESACLPGVAVWAQHDAVVNIADSYLGAGPAGPCGGLPPLPNPEAFGGAVDLYRLTDLVGSPPVLSVSRSTLDGQVSGNALAVWVDGSLGGGPSFAVADSTLVGGIGAAVMMRGNILRGSKRSLKWSTLLTAPDQQAAGIRAYTADIPLSIASSVIDGTDAPTCVGPVNLGSGGDNTAADDFCPLTGPGDQVTGPNLEPLGDHGGLGPTAPPRSNSPVVDTAGCSTSSGRDQRFVSRPQGPACDRGAVEYAEGFR